MYTYHIAISIKDWASDKSAGKVKEDLNRPNPRYIRLSIRLELVSAVPLLVDTKQADLVHTKNKGPSGKE